MKNFNFAQFISTRVNSIFNTGHVELLPFANLKSGNSKKEIFSKRGGFQFNRFISKSLLSFVMLVLMGSVSWGQSNPAAYDLSTGSFSFTTQTATNTTYPTNMQGWTTGTNNIATLTTAAPAADQSLVASGTTTTSGLSNLGASGFNFLSTGTAPNRQVGAICLSLNATGRTSLLATWSAFDGNATAASRIMNLTLQYRLGTTGTFTTVASSTYTTTGTATPAASSTFTNVALPSACDGQAIVQIRWIYYESAAQTGSRHSIRLDDITVASSPSAVPSIAISSVDPGASSVTVGTSNVVLQQYNLAVTSAATNLTGLNVTTAGTYASADITNLKVRYSTDAILDGADATLSTLTTPSTAGLLTFSSFTSQAISSGTTGYIFITADVAAGATGGNTINIASNAFTNFTFSSGTKTGTDPVAAAGVKTFSALFSSIAITNSAPASSNQDAGTTNVVLQRLDLAVTVTSTSLTGLTVTTAGSYASADITNLKVRYSTDAILDGADATLSTFTTPGVAGSKVFPSFTTQALASGATYYLFITADIAASATGGNTISLGSTAFSNISFSSGTKTGTDPVAASNTVTIVNPAIAVTSSSPAASSHLQGSTNVVLNRFDFAVTSSNATLTGITVTTAGTYAAADLVNLKCWYQTTTTFNSGTATLLSTKTTSLTTGSQVFPSFTSQVITSGTAGYIFITADISSTATSGNTISLASTAFSNLTFSLGNLTGTNPVSVGNARTFIKAEPTNYPTSFTCGTTTSTSIPLTWTDASAGVTPDGYLIQWSNTGYGSITPPTDGTAVTDLASAVLGAKNIAQGVGSYTIPSLSSLTTYYIRIWSYTNSGSNINYKLVSEPQTSCATLIAPVTIVTFPSSWVGITTTAPSTSQDANINGTVSATRGAGLVASSSGTRFSSSDWPTSGTLTLASNTDYITFTVNAAVGYLLNLNNAALNFTLGSSASGPTSYGVYSSVGGFASTAAQIGANLTISSTSVTFPSSGYDGLSTIEIRIYGWGGTLSTGTGGFASMNLTGNLVSLGTITTGTVSTSLCAGATGVSVPFTYTPSVNFPSGTATFTAQLSDDAGSFASPVTLQSVTSNGSGSQSISATIPALTTTGTGYRIRVVSASPGVNGSDNASNISISNTATSIAPSTTQNISTSTNGSTLTVTEATTASSRVWKYGTASGVYGTSTGITTSTYTPNFVLPDTYYIVCETTYPAPCSNVVTSNEVQVNVVGSVDYTWNGSVSSNWSNSSNWTPNGVPIVDDNVTIDVPGSNTLIVTDARSINSLTLSGTGTFQLTSSGALSVNGNISNSIAGSPTFDCASSFSILSTSSQTIPSWNFGNIIASGGARVLSSTGTIGICGTFTPGAGAYTNTGSTVNFNGTGAQTVNALSYNNLTISGAHTTNNITLAAGTIGVSGTFSPTATFSTGAYSNTGNTIDYNATGAQTIAAFSSYNNLTISGARASATVTLASGTIGVAGTFNPSASAVTYTSTGNTFNYTSAGSQTIAVFSQYNNLSNSGNGARTLANGIIAIYGTYTPTSAAITVGTSTVDFAGVAGQTIPASFYNNITNSSNTDRTWANAGIIDIKNTFTPTTATNTITGSTIQYSATTPGLNLTTFTTNVASRNYNNLIFNGTGGNWSLNGNTIGVAGNLTVIAGTLFVGSSGGNGILNVDGNLIVNGGTTNMTNSTTNTGVINLLGNFEVSSGTFTKLSSGASTTINFIKSSGTQTFTGGGTISNGNNWNFGNGTTANTIQIASNVSASTGVFNVNSGTTVDFGTNVLSVTSGSFLLNSGASLITANVNGISTATSNTGSVSKTLAGGTITFNAAANYTYNGIAAQVTGAGFTGSNNFTINNSAGLTLTSSATINGALTFTSGILDIAAVNLTIGASGSIAGTNTTKYVKTSSTGQLKMTVAASNVLFPVGRSAYNPLTLNNSGTSDVFGVVLADAISQSLNNAAFVVNRSWNITENIAGGSNLSIVTQWNGAGEEAASFAGGTTRRIAYWNGSAWVQTGAVQAGANPYTFSSSANLTGIASATYSIAMGKDDAFICTTAPTVSLFLPISGYAGDVITINGTGLTGLTSASVGGTAATILSQSGASATLGVGAGSTGVITVSTSPLCSASSTSSFTFLGFVSSQTGNWGTSSTWAGNSVPPSGANVVISSTHNVTTDIAATPGTITIQSGGTLTLSNAANLGNASLNVVVNGTLICPSTVTNPANGILANSIVVNNGGVFTNSAGNSDAVAATTFTVNAGGSYNHDAISSSTNGNAFDLPGGTVNNNFNANANVTITKWGQTGGTPTAPFPLSSTSTYGNLTINITTQTYTGAWNLQGGVVGTNNLTINATGSREMRMFTNGAGGTINIAGNLLITGGIVAFQNSGSTGSANATINIAGDMTVSGGLFNLTGTATTGTSGSSVVNLSGNLVVSGAGSIIRSTANTLPGVATFRFNKSSGIQTINVVSSAISTNDINWQVGNGTTAPELQMLSDVKISPASRLTVNNLATLNCGIQVLSGTTSSNGAFTLVNGGTLKIGSSVGISVAPAASGNIQTGSLPADRLFNSGANYTYSGSVNQVTGNGLPSTITGALSISNTGAALNNIVTLTTTGTTASTLNLTSGLFAAGAAGQLNISAAGTVNGTGGDFETGANAGILNFPGTGSFTGNSNPYNVYTSDAVNFGAGTVTIQPAGTFRINSGGSVNTNAPFYSSTSTLNYNTTGNYGRGLEWSTSTGRGYPHHVTISNSTTFQPGDNSNQNTVLNMAGDLTIDSGSTMNLNAGGSVMNTNFNVLGSLSLNGTLSLSSIASKDLYIGGDWTRSGVFNHNDRKVTFNGTALQTLTVTGGEIFKNLILNNTASGGIGLQINNNLIVEGTATFTNGKLDLNNNNLTLGTISANGVASGGSANSYAIVWDGADNGNIIHRVNSAGSSVYNFPMGDLTNYTPFDLTLNTGILSSAFLTGGMRAQNHPQLGTSTNYLGRYWIMNQSGITGDGVTPISYSVAYKYVDNDRSIPAQEASIYPAKYNAGGWQTPIGTGSNAMIGTGGINTGSKILEWSGLSTFSEFTGLGDGSPLPVTWLNFDAQFNNATSNVDVSWTTASEINNDYFEVLRSNDAVNFIVIGKVDGAGNSSLVKDYKFEDSNPLIGISYYKIRQVDFNGLSDNTEIRAVSNLGGAVTGTLFAYPNPLIGQDLTIVYSNLDKGNWEYRLVDITGKIVLAQNRSSESNAGAFTLNLEQLPAGIYLFQLNTQSQNFTRKITISK